MLRIPSSVRMRRVPLSCSFEPFRGAHGRCRVGEPVGLGLNLNRREFSKRAHPDPGETVVSGRSADGYFFSRQSRVNASSFLEGAVGLKRSAQVVLIGPSDGQLGGVSSCYPSSFSTSPPRWFRISLSTSMLVRCIVLSFLRFPRGVSPSLGGWCWTGYVAVIIQSWTGREGIRWVFEHLLGLSLIHI